MIRLKSKKEISILNNANCMVHDTLALLGTYIAPGITTKELDVLAEGNLAQWDGAVPTFKGYMGYPASTCISINEEIVHGIPGNRQIKNGDIVSIDFGVTYKGFVGDSACTFIVGQVDDTKQKLVNHTLKALIAGIDQMVMGNRLHDISLAIDNVAKKYKYGNIEKFCGHGIGSQMHEEPKVLNYIDPKQTNIHLQEGLVLALEPMFTLGSKDCIILNDKWTAITSDRSVAAHWEVSVAITKSGPIILGNPIFLGDKYGNT